MSIIDKLIGYLAPHDCLGCGREGSLLCGSCLTSRLKRVPERCYRCKKLSPASHVCPGCKRHSALKSVQAGVVYEDCARSLVWSLKFGAAQAAAGEMAGYMARFLEISPGAYIVPVPTATSRVRRRGYDQAVLLARELSRRTGLPCLSGLRRHGQAHQVGSNRAQRVGQLSTAFSATSKIRRSIPEKVILVDDVTTTGATLEAAANTLKRAGIKHIEAIVFAQP